MSIIEGQVISDELFMYYDVKKPIYRILLNEWTENEVKKAMKNLKLNSEMKPLQDAGIGRQIADWIIGINLTSVATLRYGVGNKQIINIGRVLLPTLKIIYDRDKEIESFKETSYFKLTQKLKNKENIEFESLYYEENEKFDLIFNFTRDAVQKIKNDNSLLHKFKIDIPKGQEELGKCPICGNSIIEGEKGFGCINWKNGCRYTIWKDDKYINYFGKKVSKEMIKLLLKNGKVGFRNLKSKKGNTFSAYFKYELNKETGYFNWKIEFI